MYSYRNSNSLLPTLALLHPHLSSIQRIPIGIVITYRPP